MSLMIRLWALLLCAIAVPAAASGTIYRCDGADGSRSYSSKRISGMRCEAASTYRVNRSANPAPARASVASAVPANAGGVTSGAAIAAPAAVRASAPASNTTRRVSGQVYSYMRDGVRHYTSRAPAGGSNVSAVRTIRYSYIETCYACGVQPGVNFGSIRLNASAYRDEIRAAAREHGVDEAIVRAVMHAESAFNPNAVSRAGAQGLMQLMPATARRFGVSNSFDPAQNIRGGVQYLAWLLRRFNGDLTLAAAGYNAGEGAVDRHKGVPPYSETRRYVERVAVLAERYRGSQSQLN